MWPFKQVEPRRTLGARIYEQDGRKVIDVSGQTCPGYLLSISRVLEPLPAGHPTGRR